MISGIIDFYRVPADQPKVNRARYIAMMRQVPLMYAIVGVNIVALSWSHFSLAPWWLTILAPIVMNAITAARSILYLRNRHKTVSDEEVLTRLRSTIRMSGVIGGVFLVWTFSMFEYGDALRRGHSIFFTASTVISCVFCLIHLRQAAVFLLWGTFPPMIAFLLFTGEPVYAAVGLSMALVACLLYYMLRAHDRDFDTLVCQNVLLEDQRETLARLSEDNWSLANTDSLTQLPNRRSFFRALDLLIENRRQSGEEFVIGLLDLDGFKPVNDLFGHPAGDQLLIETSRRLDDVFGDRLTLARLGGDEFGLIIPRPGPDEDVLELGRQITNVLAAPFDLKEGTAKIAGTLGFARYPETGDTRSILFDRADFALCYSKQHSKGSPVLFSQHHEEIIREVSSVEHRLREADLNDELSVVFQPVIDIRSGRAVGFEALARWRNPVLGDVPPDVFIRSAEQAGTISRLSEILLAKALEEAETWPEDVFLSFNLSALNLSSPEAVLKTVAQVQRSSFAARRIVFEITESAVLTDSERTIEALEMLKVMGSSIALDDFGTGFSSLSYVQRLPIDRLKIDRSFISGIHKNPASQNIVRTIAGLCQNMQLGCIVEGVETEAEQRVVASLGLHDMQGFYYSPPLAAQDVLSFLDIPLEQRRPARA